MVNTKYGMIEGIDQGEYIEYRGIPYAKAPVGDLRWKAPSPRPPIRDTTPRWISDIIRQKIHPSKKVGYIASTMLGMFASGNGIDSDNIADFDWFG